MATTDLIKQALYQQARLTILLTASESIEQSPFSDAYLLAWDREVYPACHDAADWHQPHEEQFKVREEEVLELLKYLNEQWQEKTGLTFYKLEDHYGVHGSTHSDGSWERWKLISVCHYFRLQRLFDDHFWSTLLTNGHCPSESFVITSNLDRVYVE